MLLCFYLMVRSRVDLDALSWGALDEDITPSDVPTDRPTVMQGLMTRARMRQLNLEVSSFLSDPFLYF